MRAWSLGLGLATLVLIVLALLVGPDGLVLADGARVVSALLAGEPDHPLVQILVHLRLPRVLAAVAAGVALGLSGLALQTALGNPLASPYTLGIAQAAAFGAAFAIIVFGANQVGSLHGLAAQLVLAGSAFIAAGLALAAILALLIVGRLSPYAVVLAGVGLGALFQSGTMLLQFFGTDVDVAATLFWTFGDLSKAGWRELVVMCAVSVLGLAVFRLQAWDLNALAWGDVVARSLGTPVAAIRAIHLGLACLMAAVVTAFLGIIGFVGLVAAHLARLLIDDDHRGLVPVTALIGALLMLGSDILSRVIMPPVALPVGIVTAFLGVPLFLVLLIRRARRWT